MSNQQLQRRASILYSKVYTRKDQQLRELAVESLQSFRLKTKLCRTQSYLPIPKLKTTMIRRRSILFNKLRSNLTNTACLKHPTNLSSRHLLSLEILSGLKGQFHKVKKQKVSQVNRYSKLLKEFNRLMHSSL